MIENVGKHTKRWVAKGSAAGAVIWARGDGITPTYPIREHGGVKKALFDVLVPATAAGAQADWHDTYPATYVSAGSYELGLLVYTGPIDTAANLNGKGNLLLVDACVMGGAGISGGGPPTQVGGTTNIAIKVSGAALSGWDYSAAFPAALAGVLYPANQRKIVFGTDSGLGNNLVLKIDAVTNPLTAGRLRIALFFAEV